MRTKGTFAAVLIGILGVTAGCLSESRAQSNETEEPESREQTSEDEEEDRNRGKSRGCRGRWR